MSSIRIIEMPPGFAPEEIRKQWVGLKLPLASDAEIAQDPPSGFSIGSDNADGYLVSRNKAIDVLRAAGRRQAVSYWNNFPLGTFLQFKKEVCVVIE